MPFTLDHVLRFVDRTVLNPLLAALVPLVLQFATRYVIEVNITPCPALGHVPPVQKAALGLVAFATSLRLNRLISRRALNNGVPVTAFDPSQEIVVITGGAGGFGGEAVKKFAASGCTVVILDVLDLTFPKPSKCHYYKVDLTDYKALLEVAEKIRREVGEPTTFIANAGIARGKPILTGTQRDNEVTFKVNVLALLWCVKIFLPAMVKSNSGHFLITASTTAYISTAGVVDYAASKSACYAIYEGLQSELKHIYKAPAVRLSVISPAASRTKMFETIKNTPNFFLPEITPTEVGQLMHDIIASGYSQECVIPAGGYLVTMARSLPSWIRVGFQDAAADAMSALNPHDPLVSKA